MAALCRALKETAGGLSSYTVDTVFFGGGTPSLLTAGEMERIFCALSAFSVAKHAEISVEVNPKTASLETLCAYRALGVNRISVGMQAAGERELSLLGRIHSFSDTVCCVEDVRRAGFEQLNLDLMYGLPHQTESDWENTLSQALSLDPDHLSLYALSLSETAPLYKMRDFLPSDDEQAAFYDLASSRCREAGLFRYEISNFAKEGSFCRHNLRYWEGGDYLGFGPSAASFFEGRRYGEDCTLQEYLSHGPDLLSRVRKCPPLGQEEALLETIMLHLRLERGLCLSCFSETPLPHRVTKEAQELCKNGFCEMEEGRLRLTQKGIFVSNEIISRLLLSAGL